MNLMPLAALELSVGFSVWLLLPLIVLLGWFWVTQFIQLMLMAENDFPGRQDKQIWGAAFVILFIFAPFAFWGWKTAYIDRLDELDSYDAENPPVGDTN